MNEKVTENQHQCKRCPSYLMVEGLSIACSCVVNSSSVLYSQLLLLAQPLLYNQQLEVISS